MLNRQYQPLDHEKSGISLHGSSFSKGEHIIFTNLYKWIELTIGFDVNAAFLTFKAFEHN
jgi:hypothetical protein